MNARNKILYEKYQQSLNTPPVPDTPVSEQENKYSHSSLNEQNKTELANKIKNLLNNPEMICRQGFTLKQLAEESGSNTTYVSQIINEMFGTSFSNVFGTYRVKEACRRIKEVEQYRNMTIEGIANDVGFKSRTALLNAFKREVGITPSEYLRMAASEKD